MVRDGKVRWVIQLIHLEKAKTEQIQEKNCELFGSLSTAMVEQGFAW